MTCTFVVFEIRGRVSRVRNGWGRQANEEGSRVCLRRRKAAAGARRHRDVGRGEQSTRGRELVLMFGRARASFWRGSKGRLGEV